MDDAFIYQTYLRECARMGQRPTILGWCMFHFAFDLGTSVQLTAKEHA